MYCYNCGKFFPVEDAIEMRDGETASRIYCCPWCGADDSGESGTCSGCGKEFPADELCFGICSDCLIVLDEEGEPEQ